MFSTIPTGSFSPDHESSIFFDMEEVSNTESESSSSISSSSYQLHYGDHLSAQHHQQHPLQSFSTYQPIPSGPTEFVTHGKYPQDYHQPELQLSESPKFGSFGKAYEKILHGDSFSFNSSSFQISNRNASSRSQVRALPQFQQSVSIASKTLPFSYSRSPATSPNLPASNMTSIAFSVPNAGFFQESLLADQSYFSPVPENCLKGGLCSMDAERPLTAPPGLSEKSKCIYVGNLDHRVTEFHLKDMFAEAGPVQVAKIINDKNVYRGGFKYGFVEYKTSEAAENALLTMNGRRVYGSEIKVNWAYASISPDKESNLYHIFVGDLSQEVNDYVLAKSFCTFTSFCEARIMWDFLTGRSRGFGFVAFKDKLDAETAIRTMTGKVIGGREIRCNWACYKNKEGPLGFDAVSSQTFSTNSTVYLGNLPFGSTEDDVRELLRQKKCPMHFISSIKVQAEKGFCFIKMATHEDAVQMIIELDNQIFKERELRCFWGRDRLSNVDCHLTSKSPSPFISLSKMPVGLNLTRK